MTAGFSKDAMKLVTPYRATERYDRSPGTWAIVNAKYQYVPYISGVNGKPVYRISFRLGRNDEIRKEYLSADY